ncbi:PEP-CTERM sorting domain-containing protein [Desulfococcaceae bacterium HSG9]|nr:PEP-CTERM sorting domain-containing protein [Desulfococcaceae bacterium HSG9]
MKKSTSSITKKVSLITASVCIAIFGLASISSAASLTNIYDFTYLDPTDIAFEGLAFTDDGTLWITSAPNLDLKQAALDTLMGMDVELNHKLLGVDLETESVKSVSELDMWNPVGLASDGTDLYIANNHKTGDLQSVPFIGPTLASILGPDEVFKGTIDPDTNQVTTSNDFSFPSGAIDEPEGAAYLNGNLYFSGQDSNNIVEVDSITGEITNYDIGVSPLGLGATEDSLIIGDYINNNLLLYDVVSSTVTKTISLEDLFMGVDSDYHALTGEEYAVEIIDDNGYGGIRYIPSPSGIAYKDGSIYMAFEHDLRVFEISLDDTSSVPEPSTAILLILGLVGLGFIKRRKK